MRVLNLYSNKASPCQPVGMGHIWQRFKGMDECASVLITWLSMTYIDCTCLLSFDCLRVSWVGLIWRLLTQPSGHWLESREMHQNVLSFALMRALIALILVRSSFGLYFHISETERKCFIEEVPDETLVVGMSLWLIKTRIGLNCLNCFPKATTNVNSLIPKPEDLCRLRPALECMWRSETPKTRLYCRRCTLTRDVSHSHHTRPASTSFVSIQTLRDGSAAVNLEFIWTSKWANTPSTTRILHRRKSWVNCSYVSDNCWIRSNRSLKSKTIRGWVLS